MAHRLADVVAGVAVAVEGVVVPVDVPLGAADDPHGQADANELVVVVVPDEHVQLVGPARPAREPVGLRPGRAEDRPGVGDVRDLDQARRLREAEGRHRQAQHARSSHTPSSRPTGPSR